ncbi:unnamed protein product [Microthlaspi erraticum]|uniref:Uncharacterized protein n=1 Tax=Microthlaspi erraticum TaxID=1685480 RepID=A0A6D2KRP8_9BRAS|nr:unnamed protein product [Microthlaspi erraticum]
MAKVKNASGRQYESYRGPPEQAQVQPEQPTEDSTMNEAEDPRSEDHEVQEQEKSHDGNEEETGNEFGMLISLGMRLRM